MAAHILADKIITSSLIGRNGAQRLNATVSTWANECPKKFAIRQPRFTIMFQGLLKRAIRMAGNDDQSLAAGKGCSLNRSGRQHCILGRWLMVAHIADQPKLLMNESML